MPSADPAELAAGLLGVPRREALEVDAAVDDLGLAARLRDAPLEPLAQPVARRRSTAAARRTTWRVAARTPGIDADVRDVLPVRGDDERRARRERRREARRDEEVRVDDVGPEAPRGADGVADESEVAPPSSGRAVDDGALDLVPPRDELALEVGDEDSEVRVVRARVHLRDEEDPQGRYPRVTWRIPRHISSVVPSPRGRSAASSARRGRRASACSRRGGR